ncbi:(2Fe-2S)-binding protein [Pectobacterium quasiaquaticum]|uniref:(2Fe-2S)-binding protein n=1 Tax=Pectobacterium quasiaquaticum TaxID=2774015 RepID=UPI001CF7C849|nr:MULTISPECIES: (2Fe-2S)-binding protein [Pectobacterium]
MPLYDLTVSQPELGQRDAWRDSLFDTLFAQHLSPILHMLSTVSGAPLRILWENIAGRSVSFRDVRFRRTCCFYYKASQPQEYCQNCPLLRPAKKT